MQTELEPRLDIITHLHLLTNLFASFNMRDGLNGTDQPGYPALAISTGLINNGDLVFHHSKTCKAHSAWN
jgi:hypothetical protein